MRRLRRISEKPEVLEALVDHLRWVRSGGRYGNRLCWAFLELEGFDLDGIDFSGAVLHDAQLSGCSLKGVSFVGSNLREAYIMDADLEGAVFTSANLDRAVFHGSNVAKASFTGTDVETVVWELAPEDIPEDHRQEPTTTSRSPHLS
jgi:hypothetical protein